MTTAQHATEGRRSGASHTAKIARTKPVPRSTIPDQYTPQTLSDWKAEFRLVREHWCRHRILGRRRGKRRPPRPFRFDRDLRDFWRDMMVRRFVTIKDAAEAMCCLPAGRDRDGRLIGFDYNFIRAALIRRFPVVRKPGPHFGKPTVVNYRELQEIAGGLNAVGFKLPFRPRRQDGAPRTYTRRNPERLPRPAA